MLDLLLGDPMWMVILGVTIALHLAFFLGVRWLIRQGQQDRPPHRPDSESEPR